MLAAQEPEDTLVLLQVEQESARSIGMERLIEEQIICVKTINLSRSIPVISGTVSLPVAASVVATIVAADVDSKGPLAASTDPPASLIVAYL